MRDFKFHRVNVFAEDCVKGSTCLFEIGEQEIYLIKIFFCQPHRRPLNETTNSNKPQDVLHL